MNLPPDIHQIFLNVLLGGMTIRAFEQWVYADQRLENLLTDEDYLDLIAYGYQSGDAQYGLYNLLSKHIDKAAFETRRIHQMLTKAKRGDRELPEILLTFYELYRKGYSFLADLGIDYGLRIAAPDVNNYKDDWADLSPQEQHTILSSFYPGLDIELDKVIAWIDAGKIALTGIKDEEGYLAFIDHRTNADMGLPDLPGLTPNAAQRKPWWKRG